MFRKLLILFVTAFMLATASVALAQTGNGNGNGNGNGQGNGGGNGNGCNNNGQGNGNGGNPNCTTTTVNPYPAQSAIAVRDANGNLLDGTHGLHVGDMMNIVSAGWKPGSTVAFDFFSTVVHLGDIAADSAGTVRASFAVPNVEAGQHTLRLSGIGADGKPRVVDYPILVVPASAVLGATQPALGKTAGTSGGTSSSNSGFFGKTGLAHAKDIAGLGLALFAIGAVLMLAVRRRRDDAVA